MGLLNLIEGIRETDQQILEGKGKKEVGCKCGKKSCKCAEAKEEPTTVVVKKGKKLSFKESLEMLDEAKGSTVLNRNGKKVLFSYSTPVAVKDGEVFFVTDVKHSNTTTKHINSFVGDGKKETKKQSWFDNKFGSLD